MAEIGIQALKEYNSYYIDIAEQKVALYYIQGN